MHIKIFHVKFKRHSHSSHWNFVSVTCVLEHFVNFSLGIFKLWRHNINLMSNSMRETKFFHQFQIFRIVECMESFQLEIFFNSFFLFLFYHSKFQFIDSMGEIRLVNTTSHQNLVFCHIIMHSNMKIPGYLFYHEISFNSTPFFVLNLRFY